MAERPADSVRSIEAARPLRIALLVGPMVPVPPIAYGGTERVVAALAAELSRRGPPSRRQCSLQPVGPDLHRAASGGGGGGSRGAARVRRQNGLTTNIV